MYYQYLFRRRRFFDKINKQLATKKYDLLTLVPTQRDFLEKFFRKNKVKQVLEQVDLPVLILPKLPEEKVTSLRLAGLIENIDSLSNIRDLPIFQLAKSDRKMLIHFGEQIENHPEIDVIPSKSPEKTFMGYTKNNQYRHLYIIDHKKKRGIKDFFKRSFTQKLLANGDMNLIVV